MIVDVTQHAALTELASLKNAVRRGDAAPSAAGVTDDRMTNYATTGQKSPGTTEEPTAREAVLSWAATQSRIRARATRALVSIRQTHLSFYQ
jgi:hypothetical protein